MTPDDYEAKSRQRAAELYARYSEELLAFFRAALPISKTDANDLVNLIFIELLQWFDKCPDETLKNPRAFLYTLARRHLGKYLGRLHRSPSASASAAPIDALDLTQDARKHDLEYLVSVGDGHRSLLRAMRRLGAAEGATHPVSELQLITYLKFWVGMTETEIGEILGHSRSAVARRLRTATAELRTLLEELERSEPGSTRTSTTVLLRWWQQVRARGDEIAPVEREDGPEGPMKKRDSES
jgi:RNA polymerase sigma factor (sigma-70 family)